MYGGASFAARPYSSPPKSSTIEVNLGWFIANATIWYTWLATVFYTANPVNWFERLAISFYQREHITWYENVPIIYFSSDASPWYSLADPAGDRQTNWYTESTAEWQDSNTNEWQHHE